MSILKVARMGHPMLRAVARPLERSEIGQPRFQALIDDMIETMVEYRGVGLAAPQVHQTLRLFVAFLQEDPDEPGESPSTEPVVVINPEIDVVDARSLDDWEGCLSVPDVRGRVPRARAVTVRALDRAGSPIELRAADFAARVIQHEADHLDGVLFFDRMRDLGSLTFLEEYAKYWRRD